MPFVTDEAALNCKCTWKRATDGDWRAARSSCRLAKMGSTTRLFLVQTFQILGGNQQSDVAYFWPRSFCDGFWCDERRRIGKWVNGKRATKAEKIMMAGFDLFCPITVSLELQLHGIEIFMSKTSNASVGRASHVCSSVQASRAIEMHNPEKQSSLGFIRD
jgi:hypothetical protein